MDGFCLSKIHWITVNVSTSEDLHKNPSFHLLYYQFIYWTSVTNNEQYFYSLNLDSCKFDDMYKFYKLALVHVKSGIFSFLVRSRRCATGSCGRDTHIAGRRFLKKTTAIPMNACSSTVCEPRPGFKPLIHSLLFWLELQKLIDKSVMYYLTTDVFID